MLDVDKHIGVDQIHGLWSVPLLGVFSESTCVSRGVRDLRSRPDESFTVPVGDQFRAGARLRGGDQPRGQEA
jgi:hypothetical protein